MVLTVLFIGTIAGATAYSSSHPLITQWGTTGNGNGEFYNPQNLAIDSEGNVYVTDLGNKRIQKFDNDGTFLKSWGAGGTGAGEFNSPSGIAVDENSVYVVDNQLNKIQKFDFDGNFITQWGTTGVDNDQLRYPTGITIGYNGTVFVVDTGNQKIKQFTPDGEFLNSFGSNTGQPEQFVSPIGITTDGNDNIYISDPSINSIIKLNSVGIFIEDFGPNSAGMPIRPHGLQVDPEGNIYIADGENNRVIRLDSEGSTLTSFGSMGIGIAQFKIAKDVSIDKFGNLFVIDTNGQRIQKFDTPINIEETQTNESSSTETSNESTQTNPIPNDFTKPTIMPPNDLQIEATGGLTTVSVGQALATDESGIQSLTSNAPSEFPLGITTVIWTAIDGAGNMAIATQTVTVNDTTPPTISQPSDITIEAENPTQNIVELIDPIATDVVGVMSIANDAPAVFPIGETVVTWTATDIMGNSANTVQKIIVSDSTKPTLYAPENIIFEATSFDKNEIYLGEATVIDNGEISTITNDAPEFFPLGNTTVTWVAIDDSNNAVSMEQTVSVVDTTAPVITTPENIIFEATSATGNIIDIGALTATDVQQVTQTNDAPAVFPIGNTLVTWVATDVSGNLATILQNVTVVDTTPPSISLNEHIVSEATGLEGNIVTLSEISVEDISDIASISNDSPETFPFGNTTVTWTITDNHGNVATAEQTVSIIDTTVPNVIAPSDIEIEALHVTENFVDIGQPSVEDLVEITSITSDSPTSFPIGMTTVTWTVSDSSNNISTDSQIITVVDSTPPEVISPENITVEAEGPLGNTILIGDATASDVIGVSSVTNNAPSIFPIGETIVTWTAIDNHANIGNANQTISVVDTIAPTITAPDNVSIEAVDPLTNNAAVGVAEAIDTVGVISVNNDAPGSFPVGDTIVTWTATDAAGNIATTSQTISVVDTTAPKLIIPSAKTVEATSSSTNAVDFGAATASDAVGVTSITNNAPASFPFGLTSITWTATDAAGNVDSKIQQIFVVDTTAPTIIPPSEIVVEAQSMNNNIVTLIEPQVNDAVAVDTITNDAPSQFSLGETIVTWIATDTSENSANTTQKISIIDTTSPTILPVDDITFEATSANENQVPLLPPFAEDSISQVTVTNDAPSVFSLGETLVTWTATDKAENSDTTSQTITVVDTTSPELTLPADVIIDATGLETIVSIGNANVTDLTDSAPSVTNDAPSIFALGQTIVTWTSIDSFGNSVIETQTIDVQACGKSISYYNMIQGTADDDILVGTNLPDLIFSFGGDDIISGGKGNDCIFGGEGDDIIFGNEGNDGLNGDEGNDIIKGYAGNDTISGGSGMDVIDGGGDIDSCVDFSTSDGDLKVKCES